MKLPLSFLLLLATASAAAQTPAQPTPLCARLRALTADPAVASAHWGVAVETLDGTLLCGINQAQLFRPASNAKLFTTGAALALLGPERTTETAVLAPASTPTITGDLNLSGTGTSDLSERALPYPGPNASAASKRVHPLETLALAVAARGITHITGDIVGDDHLWPDEPYAPDWSIDDTLFGYGAPVSALSADDNKLALTVRPGATPDAPALLTWEPIATFYTVDNQVRTTASHTPTSVHLTRLPGLHQLAVSGTVALGNEYTEDVAIDDPALYAAMRFKAMLAAAGVQVDGIARSTHQAVQSAELQERQAAHQTLTLPALPVTEDPYAATTCLDPCTALAAYRSVPLLEDVTLTLKVSQNLHAELLLRRLGEEYLHVGSGSAGVRVARQFWLAAGLTANDFLLFDGSGLSGHDLVAPRAFAQLLVFAARQPWFAGFKAALPVGGVDGSLTARFTGTLKGKVFAKTGTLGESRALSGYLTAASGRTIVFSILVDNHLPSSTADRTAMDHIVELIAAAN